MALTTITGAEEGIIAVGAGGTNTTRLWTSITGTPSIETSIVRTGARSYKFTGAQFVYFVKTQTASSTVSYCRLYFRSDSATPSEFVPIWRTPLTAGSLAHIGFSTGGVMQASFAGNGTVSGTLTISANTWYGLEAQVDVRNNPTTIDWRLWAANTGWVEQTQVSFGQAATTSTQHNVGKVGSVGTTLYIDDVVLGEGTVIDADWTDNRPRPGKVIRLLPNADGNHNIAGTPEFAIAAAGADIADSSTVVNTYINDDDQTVITGNWVRQKIAAAGAYVAVAFEDTVETAIRAVAVTSTHHSSSTGANQMSLRISDDAWATETAIWATTNTNVTTALYLHKTSATPSSGGSWTQDKINSLQARWGYSGDIIDIPYLDSVSIQVECEETQPAKPQSFQPWLAQ